MSTMSAYVPTAQKPFACGALTLLVRTNAGRPASRSLRYSSVGSAVWFCHQLRSTSGANSRSFVSITLTKDDSGTSVTIWQCRGGQIRYGRRDLISPGGPGLGQYLTIASLAGDLPSSVRQRLRRSDDAEGWRSGSGLGCTRAGSWISCGRRL